MMFRYIRTNINAHLEWEICRVAMDVENTQAGPLRMANLYIREVASARFVCVWPSAAAQPLSALSDYLSPGLSCVAWLPFTGPLFDWVVLAVMAAYDCWNVPSGERVKEHNTSHGESAVSQQTAPQPGQCQCQKQDKAWSQQSLNSYIVTSHAAI